MTTIMQSVSDDAFGEVFPHMSTIDPISPSDLRALAEQSNAWPFEQAKAIVTRLKKQPNENAKQEVLFETDRKSVV